MVILIILSLLTELFLTYENNQIIEKNDNLQKEAERSKIAIVEVMRNVHLLDLAFRGYALAPGKLTNSPMDTAALRKNSIFTTLEHSLNELGFPRAEWQALKDSTDAYFRLVFHMKDLVAEGNQQDFRDIFETDPGYKLFLQHAVLSRKVIAFADHIARDARSKYENAQKNIYLIQALVLLIVIPTLLYTAYFSNETYSLSEKLRLSEAQRNKILADQNHTLEIAVLERTNEILAQNEEIKAQNEEIISHNEQLVLQQDQIEKQSELLIVRNHDLVAAQQVIEKQHALIQKKNISLSSEVERQTNDLKIANKELAEQNSRLEQFAYVISHNLRAPIARLIGLTSVLNLKNPEELEQILGMIRSSSAELDGIVRDLTGILAIQNLSPTLYTQIDLDFVLQKIKKILDNDIRETKTQIKADFNAPTLFSLSPYVESILLNLIGNAIKYRHPDKDPLILIRSASEENSISLEVEDNGLGIDLNQHGKMIFSLYKRFHFHVEGKGLGLYLVRTQIEALGGQISVSSVIDKGTVFHIHFPKNSPALSDSTNR
jgi:signal transduction histidine kinase